MKPTECRKTHSPSGISRARPSVCLAIWPIPSISRVTPIKPTVLIYNCTWVCDARCEMCNNWKHGDRKADMTLAQLEPAMHHPFWGHIENLNISGGEPTTRNDLPEMVEMFQRHLPRMRKIGINTTGLTPHRAIPMLTRIVKFCAEHDLLVSVRVSLDGIGDIHNQVRHVERGFDKACETIDAMQALAERVPELPVRHRRDDLRARNLEDAREHPRVGAREEARHRVQHAALHRRDAEQQGARSDDRLPRTRRAVHAHVLPRPRAGGVGPQRPGVHVPALRRHDRQRLQADDALPVPDRRACCSTRTATCTTARTRRRSATC